MCAATEVFLNALSIPQPLPAHSRKLRYRRWVAWVGGAKKPSGGRPMIAEGRFASFDDAKAWADATHPDAPVVTITSYSALRGWQGRHTAVRKDGEWSA